MLWHYSNVFKPGCGKPLRIPMHITLDPVHVPTRRVSVAKLERVNEELKILCDEGIIRPVTQPTDYVSGTKRAILLHLHDIWDIAPCKGIRNPESNIFLPLESGILGFGIRNPVPGIRNPTRGIRNPTSPITMESRSGMYYTVSSSYVINHHLPPPPGVP